MTKRYYEGLNAAQIFFYQNLRRLLAPLNGRGVKIDLEDLAQRVAIKLGKIDDHKFNSLEDPHAYVFKILDRASIDLHRQTNDKEVGFDSFQPSWLDSKPGTNPEDAMLANVAVKELWDRCSPEEKQLLECIFDDLTAEEIAERFGISRTAARKRKERLIDKLREDPP